MGLIWAHSRAIVRYLTSKESLDAHWPYINRDRPFQTKPLQILCRLSVYPIWEPLGIHPLDGEPAQILCHSIAGS